jgi:hypothetical protein
MKQVLIVILAMTTFVAARDKKTKAQQGPYVFSSKASAMAVKAMIVRVSLASGYSLESDQPLEFRFARPDQMPLVDAVFTASNACRGMTTKKVWSYSLVELSGTTKVTVQPAWEYPDDYCQMQSQPVIWGVPEEIAAFQAMLDKAPLATPQAPTPAQ